MIFSRKIIRTEVICNFAILLVQEVVQEMLEFLEHFHNLWEKYLRIFESSTVLEKYMLYPLLESTLQIGREQRPIYIL